MDTSSLVMAWPGGHSLDGLVAHENRPCHGQVETSLDIGSTSDHYLAHSSGSGWAPVAPPMEGMNVVYLLDRSESLSADQKQQALSYVQRTLPKMKPGDHAGVVVFGEEAALELRVLPQNALPQIQSVLNTSRTDLEAAIRLGTAAFPESGQKRIILLSDGNENLGDGLAALRSALPMDVSMDVYPMGSTSGGDLSIQRIELPPLSRRQPNLRFRCLRNPMRPNPQH